MRSSKLITIQCKRITSLYQSEVKLSIIHAIATNENASVEVINFE